MMTPRVIPWGDTIDVWTGDNTAVEVHLGDSIGFTPSVDTYQGVLYGPGTMHVTGATPGVDHYVRFTSLGGGGWSDTSDPVQVTAA